MIHPQLAHAGASACTRGPRYVTLIDSVTVSCSCWGAEAIGSTSSIAGRTCAIGCTGASTSVGW